MSITASAAIDAITVEARKTSEVRALFLSGSHGAGVADRYSDIDFLAAVAEGEERAFAPAWRRAVARAGEIVMWRERGSLINAVTADWLRIDVQILAPESFSGRPAGGLRVLFDREHIAHTLARGQAATTTEPARLAWQFEEFIRILGLLPVALGRSDELNAVTGVFHLRNLLVDLLVEETGAPDRGGALHLHRLITDEQKAVLAAIPPIEATRDSVIAAHSALAAAYFPRAHALAFRRGIAWPEAFEAATWRHLARELGILPPAG